MYASSIKLLKTILETDRSLNGKERDFVAMLIKGGNATENIPNQLLSRKEVRARYFPGRSLRYVDRLASDGIIQKVIFEGRKRSSGFRPRDIEFALEASLNDK
jgi:hypothetical protein